MDSPDQLSSLIGDIYDAALDPDAWPDMLAGVAAFVGGSAAMLFWQDSVRPTGARFFSWGDDPEYTKSYFNDYIGLNPVATVLPTLAVGNVVAVSDIIEQRQLERTRFYDEWMRPQRYLDNVISNIDTTTEQYAFFAVAWDERNGLVDILSRRRMEMLVLHVRRAVLIGKLVDVCRTEASTSAALLDRIACGVFLVDLTGKIIRCNQSADALLDDGDVVSCSRGRFCAVDRRADGKFCDFLASAGAAGEISDGTRVSLSLTGRSGREYLMHMLPLNEARRRRTFDSERADAAIFIRPAEMDTPSGLALLARRHRLTPREAEVLHGIVEVGGVPEVAASLGMGVRTVKTHLHSVFAKTGTDRQAELVRLVAGFAKSV